MRFFYSLFLIALIVPYALMFSSLSATETTDLPPTQNHTDLEGNIHIFPKPKWTSIVTDIPSTYKRFFQESFSKENVPYLLGITGSTILLYYYDREILNEVQRWGRQVGLGNGDATRSMVRVKSVPVFRGPTDPGSTMYFIGDGWTHATIMASFFTYGQIKDDFRAQATSAAIAHGLIASTISNQFLKRTTGRESPYRAHTTKRGVWRIFPNQKNYNTDVSKYDAFPSGHLATFSMTASVIWENYPEYGKTLQPLFIGLGSLLGLQMVNNGVHWASDYPLAIGMGYLFGKIAAQTGKMMTQFNKENKNGQQHAYYALYPILARNDGGEGGGLGLLCLF